MRSSILCVTSGLPSVLYSSVELSRRLAAAGHRVIFAGPPEISELVEHHGLGFIALESSRYKQFLETDRRSGTLHRLLNLASRRERARESVALSGFIQSVRQVEPDLLLINGEMHEHIIAASSTGVPIALLNTFVSIWRQPGLPPPHHMVRPGDGCRGSRAGVSLLWLMLRLRKQGRAWVQRIQEVGCDRLSVLRRLARASSFDLYRETDASQWLIPFTYRRLPVLSLHALEFEFPHRPPARVHYVGPMVLESRVGHPMSDEARVRSEAILERRLSNDGARKLIYAGFGSAFSTDLDFLRRLIRIVAERDDWELVISLSDRVAPADLGPLPERVHAFPWVPQMTVLKHADVAVTHGGINTIDECVLNGVPMLVYVGLETDMAGTTARVVHHGIGIAGDRNRDSTQAICEHIDRLLQEQKFEDNLERMRLLYTKYTEDRVVENVVVSLLERDGHAQIV